MADESVDPTTPVTPVTPESADREAEAESSPAERVEPAAEVPSSGTERDAADASASETAHDASSSASAEDVFEAELIEPETDARPAVDEADVRPAAYEASPQYVVVEPPRLPRKRGNRGIGSLLALAGAVIYGALLAGIWYLVGLLSGATSIEFLTALSFYLPIVVFAIAFILLVLIVNRGAWWAYILGSLVVAAIVYFGTAGLQVGLDAIATQLHWASAPGEGRSFQYYLEQPFVITAAILAREVALWWGSLIAHRGRRMTAKNRIAREEFDRQLAEFHEKYGRTA